MVEGGLSGERGGSEVVDIPINQGEGKGPG